jgi:TRAP-type C4-dicarboxylate transport system substrate-binding protein
VYYEGSLGTPKEILEQVQFGGIAMARVNALELTEVVSSLQYYFKPQLYENTDDLMTWIWNNQEGISDSCQMERMTPLVWYYPDVRCFYSDSVSFEDVDDFQGKRIETTPVKIMKDIMDKLGAEAVESQTAETYKSLSTGYMDAGETTLSEFVLSDYYRFINFVTISEYIASPDVIVVSTVAFTSLDKKDRELIEACAQETYEYQKALLETFQKNWIPILKADKDLFLENATFKEKIDLLLRKYMGEEV